MPGTAAGTCRRKQRSVATATSSTRSRTSAILARDHHVGLEQHELQHDTLLEEGTEHSVKDRASDILAALDCVRSVHQHFRFDDRHKLLLLTERGVSRQGVCVGTHARGARQRVRNANDRPPLREAGAHTAVLGEAIPKSVEPFGDLLVGRAGERLRASVDLDARNNSLARRGPERTASRRSSSGGWSRPA